MTVPKNPKNKVHKWNLQNIVLLTVLAIYNSCASKHKLSNFRNQNILYGITNGDFEMGCQGWHRVQCMNNNERPPSQIDFNISTNSPKSGKSFAILTIQDDQTRLSRTIYAISQGVTISPSLWGRTVRLRAWFKIPVESKNHEKDNPNIYLEMSRRDLMSPNSIRVRNCNITPTTNWTSLDILDDIPSGVETMSILIGFSGCHEIYVDDVTLNLISE